jgi:mono/diheme cytochrome c family protein
MNKQRTLRLFSHSFLMLFIAVLSASTLQAQEFTGDVANGKSLFNGQCAACHKLDKKVIGPALGEVTNRRTKEWLYAWIRDNQALRESGDADAIAVYEEFNGSVMTAFPGLSDSDIDDILAYTIEGSKPKVLPAGAPIPVVEAESDNSMLLYILGGILIFLVLLLTRVKNTLKQVQGDGTTSLTQDANIFTRTALKNPRVVTLLTILVAVIFFQQLYIGLSGVNLEEGYQPSQPIKFSHELHAGQNEIDCNYCHSGARKSKHSNIPSANVCMNCHVYIQEGPKYGTEEISKIYAAIGFDPETSTYIEGYEEKPIKWVRIHKLPDLAYFNHSQHVTAGNVECQTCHGPIQEMEEVYQYSPLTMEWCITCHRETKVDVKSNDYYKDMHTKLKAKYGPDAEITVQMIGGLECGKCHY